MWLQEVRYTQRRTRMTLRGLCITGVYKSRVQRRPCDEILFVGRNGYGFSVWNLLHSIVLTSRILRWLLDFWKIFAHVVYGNKRSEK